MSQQIFSQRSHVARVSRTGTRDPVTYGHVQSNEDGLLFAADPVNFGGPTENAYVLRSAMQGAAPVQSDRTRALAHDTALHVHVAAHSDMWVFGQPWRLRAQAAARQTNRKVHPETRMQNTRQRSRSSRGRLAGWLWCSCLLLARRSV
jgi:hypothetical protein